MSRKQFINQVPAMLDVLGQRLLGKLDGADFVALAYQHGLHRWQNGYTLANLSAEIHHLTRLLLSELRAFWELGPSSNATMAFSCEQVSEFGNQINTGSITQYADLQRQAAFSRAEALEKTLKELNEIGRQRSDLLRNSSHDLRSSFSAVQGAAALLELIHDSEQERNHVLEILRRNLTNCRTMVTQLMDLARLEAGREVAKIKQFDAGKLLGKLVSSYEPLAAERGLTLKAQGPENLPVECDPVHLQRIVQNLVLNALKHTSSGWVAVHWAADGDKHWTIHVQDSGPGLPTAPHNELVDLPMDPVLTFTEALKTDTDTSDQEMVLIQPSGSAFSHTGEGIGLSIVKGLCELLRAQLDIESRRGHGTIFRIKLCTCWES